ncbi:MAG: TlpA family protein disulfide reductase [Candidatus Eremiobacteraeota bacterium]|nr:TlpA family protein disulfide reductase [Candidatus Eremiobacteraeota bacterium]
MGGAPAASFDVPRTDGRSDSLARHRGHVVLLNLWATWCPPCQQEMPALERFAREHARDVVVLGVDQGESSSTASAFAREHGVTFPILVDEQQQYGRTYAAVGLPTTVIVGRDGRVVRGIDGPLTLAQMRDAVAPALAAK